MSTTKKKKPVPFIVLATEEAMVGALNRHAELALRIKAEDAAHEEHIAGLNAAHSEAMQPLLEELAQLEGSIHLFSINNRWALFPDGEKKSRDYANATIGFRWSSPSVGTIVPRESMTTIAMRLEALEWGEPYVKSKPVVDKAALLRDREKLTPEQLAAVGIKFEQEETFFIEPAASAADRVVKPANAA